MANLYEFLDHAETRIGVSEDQHSQYDWARFAELAKICEVVNESAGLTLWHCAQAFMFYTRDFRENMREPYFAPITSYTSEQGEVCEGPPWRDMPKEALDLYRDRVCRTSNEVARTRYADIVWEKERDYKMALIAYAGYLAQAENYEVKGWLRPTIEALGRAMEIALTLQEVGRVSETLVAIRGFVDRCHEAGTFETLPLLELVAGMKRRFLADDALEWATSRASEAAEHFSSVGGEALWSERSYLGVMVKVLRRRGLDSKNASRRIALSLKRHGLEHQSALIGSSHLRAAITAFQALGDRDEVATLLALFQEMSQRAGAEFGTIQSEISVPTEEVERYLGFFVERDNLAQSLQLVSVHFQPNVETSRNQALELKKTSPLQFMIPNQTVSHDGRVVGNATTEEEIFEHQVMRQVRLGYHIGASFIAQIFGRLVDRGLDASSLTAFLCDSDVIGQERRDFIERGLVRYFEKDWVSAIHVLVFQLEYILRSMLATLGGATTYQDQATGRHRVLPLDAVLREPVMRTTLGENLSTYLYAILTDEDSENTRNYVAHGLIPWEQCDETRATLIVHLLMTLTIFRKGAAQT